ncbi:MAG: DNA polymerase III subunit delta [Mycoplasma sp.]|nr:DNA polymerase III subunit delta [Mycoplasma sp.]
MYFIYGTEDYLISNEEKRIVNKIGQKPIIFDELSSINEILQEIMTVNLFANKKLIIIRNGDLFSNDEDSKKVVKLLEKGLDGITLVFILNEEKPKVKNPLISYLMSNSNTKQIQNIKSKDIIKIIQNMFEDKNVKITTKALILLSKKLPNNLMIINNEINKLILRNKEIDIKDIEESISDYTSDDFFAFTNAILNKDKEAIFSSYNERIIEGDDPQLLIGQISSILLLINKLIKYLEENLSLKEISEKTKIHIFRLKKANELLQKIPEKDIKQLIKKLSDLDVDIKKGNIDSKIGLEKFLLDFIK